jgi:hypothetical protein
MAKKMTRAGALIEALGKRGWKMAAPRGNRIVMKRGDGSGNRAWIGPQGALRIGKLVTKSRVVTYSPYWKELLADGGYENGNGAGSGEAKSR